MNFLFRWVWSEAGSQPDLEVALEIGGFGYPAMALLNHKKMKYSILKGSFSHDGISEFLRLDLLLPHLFSPNLSIIIYSLLNPLRVIVQRPIFWTWNYCSSQRSIVT